MLTDNADTAGSGRTYHIGAVGAGARVQQGERLTWIETQTAALPGGDELARQFTALLKRIADAPGLDDDTRALAQEKTDAIVKGRAEAKQARARLRHAVVDAKGKIVTAPG